MLAAVAAPMTLVRAARETKYFLRIHFIFLLFFIFGQGQRGYHFWPIAGRILLWQ
jgi:hypothetical protein